MLLGMPMATPASAQRGFLFDLRVLELADHKGEFLGRLLAGAGADLLKIEPPQGSPTRAIGPFYEDKPDPERSLHFWHYNFGKRGISLDIAKQEGAALLKRRAARSDILIETFAPGYMASLGLDYAALQAVNPSLIYVSITPFGQTGPWRDWRSSDLVHLALGGVMMNCGYDPQPTGDYDLPPIAPQMWQATHIACNQANIAVLGALLYRERTGKGQHIDVSMHQAVSCNTEADVPYEVYGRIPLKRQTARHALPAVNAPTLAITKDGRYLHVGAYNTNMRGETGGHRLIVELLEKHKSADDLGELYRKDPASLQSPKVARHLNDVMRRWVAAYKFNSGIWEEGQRSRLHWAPIRRPEENLDDPHWQARHTFTQVYHKELGRTLPYIAAPWMTETCPPRHGPRAPSLGEHNAQVYGRELGMTKAQIASLRRRGII